MLPKLKGSGTFNISYTICNMKFGKVLCDLGASIYLILYSVFRKLNLGETKATSIFLQLADKSIKFPRKIIEVILMKVEKFIYLADFVILDMVG